MDINLWGLNSEIRLVRSYFSFWRLSITRVPPGCEEVSLVFPQAGSADFSCKSHQSFVSARSWSFSWFLTQSRCCFCPLSDVLVTIETIEAATCWGARSAGNFTAQKRFSCQESGSLQLEGLRSKHSFMFCLVIVSDCRGLIIIKHSFQPVIPFFPVLFCS